MGKELNPDKKARDIHERATERSNFAPDLQKFVKEFGVPQLSNDTDELAEWLVQKYGDSVEEYHQWLVQRKHSDEELPGTKYIRASIAFLRKYGFSVQDDGDAMDTILLGGVPAYMNFDMEPPMERNQKVHGRRSLKIVVYEGATRDELINYVKREWKWMQGHLLGDGSVRSRVRTRSKKSEDELILKYWKLPMTELRKLCGDTTKGGYREIFIQQILREKHGIRRSSDAIKKAADRRRSPKI